MKNKFVRMLGGLGIIGMTALMPMQTQISPIVAQHFAAKKVYSANASANWAGYAATGTGYSSMQANWVIPKVKPSKDLGVDATWIGIGGITSSDLIQTGTEAVTQNGSVQYMAWTEALPAASEPLNLTVHAGDTITASITEMGTNNWQLSIADNTSGQSASKAITYTSNHSSAEWIEEAPSDASGILPLDDFGSVTFSNGQVMKNGKELSIKETGAQPIVLAGDDGQLLARPSTLSKDGQSFSVVETAVKSLAKAHRIFGAIATWTHGGHGIKKRRVHD